VSLPRPERADAVRNRRAILAATEELLAARRPRDISIEQVALAAGVGKGTVFHRFGSRMGLMTALMIERAQALTEAVASGPPPLGPGAPDRERLLAFLDAVIEVVGRNKSLLAELAFSGVAEPAAADKGAAADEGTAKDGHPVYRFWHGHISTLIAAQRPEADAEMIAHVLLGALHSEPILACLAADGPARPAAAVRALACAVLDAPALGQRAVPDQAAARTYGLDAHGIPHPPNKCLSPVLESDGVRSCGAPWWRVPAAGARRRH
jgi:AcrR family transcriptional regulator